MGTPVKEDDFKKAARRLGDMGVFTDIGYSFSYSSAGTKVEFQVTDVDKFVPVRFEDFVWFPEQELRSRIKEHAPLFDGEVPLSGRMSLRRFPTSCRLCWWRMQFPGTLNTMRSGKPNGPIDSIVYRMSEVLIQVRNIEFTGAGEAELPALKAASQRLATANIPARPRFSGAEATASSLLFARISEGSCSVSRSRKW